MSSPKLHSDQSSGKATKEPDRFLGCKECNMRFHHEGSIDKPLNVAEVDCRVSRPGRVDQIAKLIGEGQFVEHYFPRAHTGTDDLLHLDQHLKEYDACMKNVHQGVVHSLNSLGGDNSEKIPVRKDVKNFWGADDQLMELDSYYCLASKQPTKPFDSHSICVEKSAPWWRTVDKDMLSSVSLESSSYIKNWDLPLFQSTHLGSQLQTGLQCVDLVHMEERNIMDATDCNTGHLPSVNTLKAQRPSGVDCFSPQGLSQLLSDRGVDTAKLQSIESEGGSDELSKSQLLEALCHSQTRAREAETLAQQAYDEKEHVINLFFRQASYLFAYRQWLQILQLETLCLQFRNKDQCKSSHFQGPLPFVRFKGRRLRKGQGYRRPARRKQGTPRIKLNGCALAFAVGFSLAGAGLLIGWTLGWLFPAF